VPIPSQPQDLVRFPTEADHLLARHALRDHFAIPANLLKVRNHVVPFARIASSAAGVKPPTSPGVGADAEYMKPKVLTGDTFDKSYIKTMGQRSPR
jgi:hypothetical protein